MTSRTVTHATYVIERRYAASPEKTFAAFADADTKRRWMLGPDAKPRDFEMDFRVGGREVSRSIIGGGPFKGTPLTNETVYQDIVPNERVVFAYSMTIGDHRMSASLVTVELKASGNGTMLVFTDQGAYFENSDGAEMRKAGWTQLLERLEKELSK